MTDSEGTGAGDVLAAQVLERQKATTETETLTGSSSDTLSNNSNKNIQNLDNGVEKLNNFPPRAPKK
jgi:hypothetical protein